MKITSVFWDVATRTHTHARTDTLIRCGRAASWFNQQDADSMTPERLARVLERVAVLNTTTTTTTDDDSIP